MIVVPPRSEMPVAPTMFWMSLPEITAPVWNLPMTPPIWKPSPAVLEPIVLFNTWLPLSSVVVEVPRRKTPYCALLIRLLLIVFDELAASAFPLVLIEVPPAKIPISVVVDALPVMTQFFTVLLLAPPTADG